MKRRDFLRGAFATALGYVMAPAAMQIVSTDYKWVPVPDDQIPKFHHCEALTLDLIDEAMNKVRMYVPRPPCVILSPRARKHLERATSAVETIDGVLVTMSRPVPAARPRTPSGSGLRSLLRKGLGGS